jgi:hypothetical protein
MDNYIDQYETLIYGKFACEQMRAVCLGKVKELDGMVKFAVARQEEADDAMKAVLDRQPRRETVDDPAAALAEGRDVIVRFGSHLDSLKGRPVDPATFFQGEAPSTMARRRITKLVAAVGHLIEELNRNKSKVREYKMWHEELSAAHAKLSNVEIQQRSRKVDQILLAPDVAGARIAWLGTYTANKALIRGLLLHLGKLELMPHIFDDLAETQRASGVTPDPVAPGAASNESTAILPQKEPLPIA